MRPASGCRSSSSTACSPSRGFNEGFATTEYLAAAAARPGVAPPLARATPTRSTDVAAFEREALAAAGLDDPLDPAALLEHVLRAHLRGRLRRGLLLVHLERGAGADIMAWFEEHGGATRENGDRFRARSSPRAAHATRVSRSERCSGASRRSSRCCAAAASGEAVASGPPRAWHCAHRGRGDGTRKTPASRECGEAGGRVRDD